MPLYMSDFTPDKGGWAVWQCTETDNELRHLLPSDGLYNREMDSFHAHARRIRERLAVRVLMYACWGKEHTVAYLPSKAPYLTDSQYRISISHTDGYAAICWHPSSPVGIDIELLRPKTLRLIPRFMHPSEHAEGNLLTVATLNWSAKETLYKLLPCQEATDFIHHLRIAPFTLARKGVLIARDVRQKNIVYTLHYRVESDFVLTWLHPYATDTIAHP